MATEKLAPDLIPKLNHVQNITP